MKKYLFDLHRFDDPNAGKDAQEEDNLPPPPPTYTEDDLKTATDEAYRRGRQDGFRESEEAISREIATLIGIMNTQLDDLLQQETKRQSDYLADMVTSLQSLYAQTVPTLVEHQAWPMLSRMAQDVVDQHKAAAALEFIVPEDYVETLKAHLEKLYGARAAQFTVKGDRALNAADSRVTWANGGAIQNLGALQAQILERLNQLLAENSAAAHNPIIQAETSEAESSPPDTGLQEELED